MAFSAGQVLTAAQLNDLDITTLTTTGVVDIPNGSESAPSLANTGDLDTGLFFPADNAIGLTAAGTTRLTCSSTDTVIRGPVQTKSTVYLQADSTAPTGTEGDVELYFGDLDDANSAGIVWDESLQMLSFRGYNNQEAFKINASEQTEFVAGAVGTPAITFADDANSGFYVTGNNGRVDWSGNGVNGGYLYAGGVSVVDGVVGLPSFNFMSDTNTGLYLASSTTGTMRFSVQGSNVVQIASSNFSPVTDNTIDLGLLITAWKDVYYEGTITDTSSDIRTKTLVPGKTLGLDFIRSLEPTAYYKRKSPDILRQGVIAQDVAAGLVDAGIDPATAAMWTVDPEDDLPGGRQGVAYLELIAPLARAVQELADKVDAL